MGNSLITGSVRTCPVRGLPGERSAWPAQGLLLDTGYTIDGVRERLGDVAATALSREETVPALRATAEGDPLATLIRLWWLGAPVEARGCRRAFPWRNPPPRAW